MNKTRNFIIEITNRFSEVSSYIHIDFVNEDEAIEQFNKVVFDRAGHGLVCAYLYLVGSGLLDLTTVINFNRDQITDKWIEELILEVG